MPSVCQRGDKVGQHEMMWLCWEKRGGDGQLWSILAVGRMASERGRWGGSWPSPYGLQGSKPESGDQGMPESVSCYVNSNCSLCHLHEGIDLG